MNQSTIQQADEKLTVSGKWAFLSSLMFVFSISIDYRLSVVGLLVHPFLLILPLAIFFTGFNIFKIPERVLIPLGVFLVIFSVASLQSSRAGQEILKVSASVLTFLFFATSVRTRKDFRTISLGFIICAVIIGYLAIGASNETKGGARLEGINVLEGIGNKNAQSLFTLPGLFFCILITISNFRSKRYIFSLLTLLSLFFIVVSIFLSANRSGWVGLGIIILVYLIYFRLSTNFLFIALVLISFSYLAVDRFASDIVEHKQKQTLEGYESDEGRLILMKESLRVGIENPFLGVGMDELHKRMNQVVHRSSVEGGLTDTHFLIGYIFGSTGLISLLFFFIFLFRLVKREKIRILIENRRRIDDSWKLLVGFVILFIVRSFFTREILYSPTFIGGMGLIYGNYLMNLRNGLASR